MTINFGFFGGGGQYDENLQSKIDNLLAGKPSAKDKIDSFLEEAGVDPDTIPFNMKGARQHANNYMTAESVSSMTLHGNSLHGLTKVQNVPDTNTSPTCPVCSSTDTYVQDTTTCRAFCYDCEDNGNTPEFSYTPPEGQTLTAKSGNKDWNTLKRCYDAFRKEWPNASSYQATRSWGTEAEITALNPVLVNPNIKDYPANSLLRVVRRVAGQPPEDLVVRIGGLFDDTTPTIVATMQPITDLSGLTVEEVLE